MPGLVSPNERKETMDGVIWVSSQEAGLSLPHGLVRRRSLYSLNRALSAAHIDKTVFINHDFIRVNRP